MIIGVGMDLVSVGRIQHLISEFDDKFLQKIFTKKEINQANNINNRLLKDLFYAKRFAAKEAFSKAIGLGIGRGLDFKDIEVENNNLGAPKIILLNDKDKFLIKHFGCDFSIHLSLTDENPLASAFVIIESK